ncbi:MAG TPA: MoaD/ThiS family protein [Caulobacteraceae bacterium]|nr:MoaD/ThiS family protein [Caulobacteraceae bacterium]
MARVLLFGQLADLAGWRERTIEAPTLAAMKALLAPELDVDAPGVNAAVDRAIVRGDVELSTSSEVAFLPPMSGG